MDVNTIRKAATTAETNVTTETTPECCFIPQGISHATVWDSSLVPVSVNKQLLSWDFSSMLQRRNMSGLLNSTLANPRSPKGCKKDECYMQHHKGAEATIQITHKKQTVVVILTTKHNVHRFSKEC